MESRRSILRGVVDLFDIYCLLQIAVPVGTVFKDISGKSLFEIKKIDDVDECIS